MKFKPLSERPALSVSVLSLDREDRTRANFLHFFERAAKRGSGLIVIPFGFPEMAPGKAKPFFSRLARTHQVWVAAAFAEKGKRLAAVFSRQGEWLGEYAQVHRLPDEAFEPGDELKPIPTEIGALGLSIGSDLFFPETHWSLAQQGADLLIHFEIERGVCGHFYSEVSPKVRAFDVQKPLLVCSPSSCLIKLVHNEEMGIGGVPMTGSVIHDQNGARLASTGFSQGIASADLRLYQHCRSAEEGANMPLYGGLDVFKLYFNASRKAFFADLRRPYTPLPKPHYRKRKIRVAVLSHFYCHQLDKDDETFFRLLKEACHHEPDIILATEMEKGCQPEEPQIKRALGRAARLASNAGSYLIVGGIRQPARSGAARCSHAWLWDRKGKLVFKSAIMLYGKGCGQECFDTDFGRIGIRLCGDVYAPELDRLFALKGADIVFNPSMAWGASGLIQTELNRARAMDNGHFVVSAHLAFSDPGQRSHVIDPVGCVVAASDYYSNSVLLADIELDSRRGVFVKGGQRDIVKGSYLEGWRTPATHYLLKKDELLKYRRPELYEMIDYDVPSHPFTTRDRGDGFKLELKRFPEAASNPA